MDLVDDLAILPIESGDAPADAADKFVVKGICRFSDLLHGDRFFSVSTDEHYPVTYFYMGDIRYVHHHLIHADSAQNGRFLSSDQHIEAIA